jgi:hypothetical protein
MDAAGDDQRPERAHVRAPSRLARRRGARPFG